jgi:hypothetical protein
MTNFQYDRFALGRVLLTGRPGCGITRRGTATSSGDESIVMLTRNLEAALDVSSGVRCIDWTDPDSPVVGTRFNPDVGAGALVLGGIARVDSTHCAVITTGSASGGVFYVVDCSTPGTLTTAGSVSVTAEARSVKCAVGVPGGKVFVGQARLIDGFGTPKNVDDWLLFDCSDPTSPTLSGSLDAAPTFSHDEHPGNPADGIGYAWRCYNIPGTQRVLVIGGSLLSNSGAGFYIVSGAGFQIVDCSGSAPVSLGVWFDWNATLTEGLGFWDGAIVGDRFYATPEAAGDGSFPTHIKEFDISDPTNPTLVSTSWSPSPTITAIARIFPWGNNPTLGLWYIPTANQAIVQLHRPPATVLDTVGHPDATEQALLNPTQDCAVWGDRLWTCDGSGGNHTLWELDPC